MAMDRCGEKRDLAVARWPQSTLDDAADSQQQRMLERLRRAGEKPIKPLASGASAGLTSRPRSSASSRFRAD
jgi:hypothetical protein